MSGRIQSFRLCRRVVAVLLLQATIFLSIYGPTVDAASSSGTSSSGSGSRLLMDAAGRLQLSSSLEVPTKKGIVTVVASPDTPSLLVKQEEGSTNQLLSLAEGDLLLDESESLSNKIVPFICRGATLSGTSEGERTALAVSSLISSCIIVDGITAGDVEMASLRNSRHARTLTALFRPRIVLHATTRTSRSNNKNSNSKDDSPSPQQQRLILAVNANPNEIDETQMQKDVLELYKAAAMETNNVPAFESIYELQIVTLQSAADASKVMTLAGEAAAPLGSDTSSLNDILLSAHQKVGAMGLAAVGLDTPAVAHAFVAVGNAFSKYARTVRAVHSSWKSRTARGLVVDDFGYQAQQLLGPRVLDAFDAATMAATGLPLVVAKYRTEVRQQLVDLIESSIRDSFNAQVANLEQSTLRSMQRRLLQTAMTGDPTKAAQDEKETSAAALRQAMLTFDTIMESLQVPGMGLTKDKYVREMARKLNDAAMAFPDSPAARVKRSKLAQRAVKKEKKKPTQKKPAIDWGLDLVAVLRPDGYGSLQGFVGYQLLQSSRIIFGVNNDADDPQVLAQFGGVRPPLLKLQPQLKLDIEL